LTDHLNTVRDIARYDSESDTTTVVNHLVYDAYGNVTSETNSAVDSLFLFTARPLDPDTGLQNNLNRWYDPAVGRWLSEDPIGYNGGINLYEYVNDNPLLLVDPAGTAEISEDEVLGAACRGNCRTTEISSGDIAKQPGTIALVCCRSGDYAMHWNDTNKDVLAFLRSLDEDGCGLSDAVRTHEKHHFEQLKKICGRDFCKGKDSTAGKILAVIPPSSPGCKDMMECFAHLAGLKYALDKGLSYDSSSAKGKKCCAKALALVKNDIAMMQRYGCPPAMAKFLDMKKIEQLERCCR
jgi:RHS repeat-associated protein